MRLVLLISAVVALHAAAAKPRENPVERLGGIDAAALGKYTPQPQYPPAARLKRIAGSGVYCIEVEVASGTVRRVYVQKTTGSSILDDEALATFRRWRFEPQRLRSIPWKCETCKTAKQIGLSVPVTFSP